MNSYFLTATLLGVMSLVACTGNENRETRKDEQPSYAKGSFGYDLQFLQRYDSVITLKNEDGQAMVIVSPQYQGKVFTSTAGGLSGNTFGWVNYNAFGKPTDPHMNAYGGENRFWLGPEGGVYSLFFEKGDSMVFDNWKTPPPIDSESWEVVNRTGSEVLLQKNMRLTNYKGTTLQLKADRRITILANDKVAADFGIALDTSVKVVGYQTVNSIANTGTQAWNESTGMPCIWMLDMFTPSPQTVVVIPYDTSENLKPSKVATTDYFGEIPADRLKYRDGVLFFKADGQSRGKLGIAPGRAKPFAGSYDALNGILTITRFNVDKNGKYLNQEWNTQKPPFTGDAVNAYNDGPLADGTQMGPFYEIESVSPAALLEPGETLTHHHAVYHVTGNKTLLDKIVRKLLGVSLADIEHSF